MSSASEKAYQKIRQGILNGDYPSGSPLKEVLLSEVCGLSRTPIRQAIQRLVDEGLANIHDNRRAYVATLSQSALMQAYDLAAMLESYSASLAARNARKEDIENLEALTRKMERLNLSKPEHCVRFLELNTDFHLSIHRLSGNPELIAMIKLIPDAANNSARFGHQVVKRSFSKALEEHRNILEALKRSDSSQASRQMKTHVESNRRTMLELVQLNLHSDG
ncbi:GntR family transcriptional regulator [Pseudomaricurvus alkylphenolicus]|uniref:GntR family transcriptional regulator n=1 Tax=Pseudomaricurvus alkylphenolicus TaxID=1306991 RepID=UPI00141F8D2F|nr:GntR family transcriptional regulator [Pseudomaricurvus alkylphenolicus]NIB38903.1 GntR family transcriptional regulator [Pseudomaricurvus alkylphenolicus]